MAKILYFPKRREAVDDGPRAVYVRQGRGRLSRPLVAVFDQARRQLDYLGGPGIRLKRGLTDRKIRTDGFMRVVFPKRSMARKFQRRIELYCDPSLVCERRRLKAAA